MTVEYSVPVTGCLHDCGLRIADRSAPVTGRLHDCGVLVLLTGCLHDCGVLCAFDLQTG